jgi:pimeloyl-ACP methyl ester carboxylesterase
MFFRRIHVFHNAMQAVAHAQFQLPRTPGTPHTAETGRVACCRIAGERPRLARWLLASCLVAAALLIPTAAFSADAPKAAKDPDAAKPATGDAAKPEKADAPKTEKTEPPKTEKADPPKTEKKEAKPPEANRGDGKSVAGPPPVQELELLTNDGLRLALSYYPGTKGKESIPIVLLHMWKKSRADYKPLALYLQSLGHAVIAPDLRGHGQSVRFKGSRKDDDLKAANLPLPQFAKMVTEDTKAVKDFLWERNNAEELNLDKLCVVGAEMGASVALDWAAYDAVGYDNNMVTYGPLRLGAFVKALVLISPEWAFKSLSLKQAASATRVQGDIPILILVGQEDRKAFSEAKRINTFFERFHAEPKGDDKFDKMTLFLVPLETKLQGTSLLDPKLHGPEYIADFINKRLIKAEEAQDWVWKERKRPHE